MNRTRGNVTTSCDVINEKNNVPRQNFVEGRTFFTMDMMQLTKNQFKSLYSIKFYHSKTLGIKKFDEK